MDISTRFSMACIYYTHYETLPKIGRNKRIKLWFLDFSGFFENFFCKNWNFKIFERRHLPRSPELVQSHDPNKDLHTLDRNWNEKWEIVNIEGIEGNLKKFQSNCLFQLELSLTALVLKLFKQILLKLFRNFNGINQEIKKLD